MNDFRSLKLLDKMKGLFTAFGIEYEKMRKILQVKLMMDQRRVPTIFNDSKKKTGNQFLKSLGLYALYGLILIPFLVLGENYLFQMSLVFGMVMFILMTSMIADFSTVLLDVRDKTVLNTKPVSSRTVSAAKIVHVSIYMSLLTGAFAAIPFIVSVFVQGIGFSIIFLLELVSAALLSVVLTALLYIGVLRFFSGEKLKDIINYVQVLLSVGIVVGYQVLIRVFEFADMEVTFTFQWWHLLLPPIWYGAPFELLLHQNTAGYIIVYSAMALCVPMVAIAIYARLVPSFERNLQKLLNNNGANKQKPNWVNRAWAAAVCSSKEERAFFQYAAKMIKREREFKLKVYPSLGMALVFPLLFLFNQLRISSFAELADSTMYLTIYFCNVVILPAVDMLKYSDHYKGAWIFRAAPVSDEAHLPRAVLKAFLAKLYLPVFVLLSAFFIWLFSISVLLDLLVALLTGLLIALAAWKPMNGNSTPFSQSFAFLQSNNTAAISILMMMITGLMAGVHYLATTLPYGILGYLVVLLALNFLGWGTGWAFRPGKDKDLDGLEETEEQPTE